MNIGNPLSCLLCLYNTSPLFLKHFLTFWYRKVCQAHLARSQPLRYLDHFMVFMLLIVFVFEFSILVYTVVFITSHVWVLCISWLPAYVLWPSPSLKCPLPVWVTVGSLRIPKLRHLQSCFSLMFLSSRHHVLFICLCFYKSCLSWTFLPHTAQKSCYGWLALTHRGWSFRFSFLWITAVASPGLLWFLFGILST